MAVSDEIKQEHKKLKFMTKQEKIQYIWEYYKLHIAVTIVAIIFLSLLIHDLIEGNKPVHLYACLVNANMSTQTESTLLDDYIAYAGIDTKKENTAIDMSMHIDLDSMDQVSLAYQQKIMALLSSKDLDVLIADNEMIQKYGEMEAFLDLESVLPEALKDELEKKGYEYVTCKLESGEMSTIGISIGNSRVLAMDGDFGAYEQDSHPVFTIPATSVRLDQSLEFLRFLISQDHVSE
ncbi:MAG: hypothetical protein GX567_09630 [Clostridia bacterium]|nr:hypothetical protein [Clostridia bacterium]